MYILKIFYWLCLAVIWKSGWNPREGVSVRVICDLIHAVQHKYHGLGGGGFLHQILVIKIYRLIKVKADRVFTCRNITAGARSEGTDSALDIKLVVS